MFAVPAIDHDDTDAVSADEQWAAYAGCGLCVLGFVAYLLYCIIGNSSEAASEITQSKQDAAWVAQIHNGTIGMLAIIELVLADLRAESAAASSGSYGSINSSERDAIVQRFRHVLKPFFLRYDDDRSGCLCMEELRRVFADMGSKLSDADLAAMFARYDTDASGTIEYGEFVRGVVGFVVDGGGQRSRATAAEEHAAAELRRRTSVPPVPTADDDEDEEEDVPDDFKEMSPAEQQRAIKWRAAKLMALGTALVLVFSDPMVDVMSEIGVRFDIPAFYVSFVLAPLASNASELIASYNYALKKTSKTITISLVALEGAAIMNNSFCLGIFLALVAVRGLAWQFTAETLAILVVQAAMAVVATFRVQRLWFAWVVLSFYPLSLVLVASLEANGVD